MTGQPGALDLVKKIPESAKWYIDTVDSNLEKIQECRKKSEQNWVGSQRPTHHYCKDMTEKQWPASYPH